MRRSLRVVQRPIEWGVMSSAAPDFAGASPKRTRVAFYNPKGTLQRLARWRCAKDFYRLPLEMLAMNALAPTTRLS